LFVATGSVSPFAVVEILSAGTPYFTIISLTAFARLSESLRLYASEPVLSVCPMILALYSGVHFKNSEKSFTRGFDSSSISEESNLKLICRFIFGGQTTVSVSTTCVNASILHPEASTFVPLGVVGHLSTEFSTPSLSLSPSTVHPSESTVAPEGVFGHLSLEFKTPSLSSSFSTWVGVGASIGAAF